MADPSTRGIRTVLHPVSDLAAAKAVYTALLGVAPQADAGCYVGFDTAGQHVGLVPGGGPQGMTTPVAYRHDPPRNVGGGRPVATVTDPDGNVLGLLEDRKEPTDG
jgi:hypothetical protein